MTDLFESRGASPMLIARQEEAFDDPNSIYELKLDGIRCLAYFNEDTADLRNKRNLQLNAKFPELRGRTFLQSASLMAKSLSSKMACLISMHYKNGRC